MDLEKLPISHNDLIKSPSFFFKIKISPDLKDNYEILRVDNTKLGSSFRCTIVKISQHNSQEFSSDFDLIKRKFLNKPEKQIYDPKTFDMSKFTKQKNKEETSKEEEEEPKEEEEEDKPKKSETDIEKEKRFLATKFRKIKLVLKVKNGNPFEFISSPFIFPGKITEVFFSLVLLPNFVKNFIFYNPDIGFESSKAIKEHTFSYFHSDYKLFYNVEEEILVENPEPKKDVTGNTQTPKIVSIDVEISETPNKNGGQNNNANTSKDVSKQEPNNGKEVKNGSDLVTQQPKNQNVKENQKGSPNETEAVTEKDQPKEEKSNPLKPNNTGEKSVVDSSNTKTNVVNQNNETPVEKEKGKVLNKPKDNSKPSEDPIETNKNEIQNNTAKKEENTIVDNKKPVKEIPPVAETKPVKEIAPVTENKPVKPILPVPETKPAKEIPPVKETIPVKPIAPVTETIPVKEIPPVKENKPVKPNTPVSENTENKKPVEAQKSKPVVNEKPKDIKPADFINNIQDKQTEQANKILDNSKNVVDVEKLRANNKLNKNPDFVANQNSIANLNENKSIFKPKTDPLNNPANTNNSSIVQPETNSQPESRLLQATKDSKQKTTPKEEIEVQPDLDESKLPHLMVYHFAIIENFYGAIFNSQGDQLSYSHSSIQEYFKLYYPHDSQSKINQMLNSSTPIPETQEKDPKKLPKSKLKDFNPKIKGCSSKCSIPLGESLSANFCLSCTKGVLDAATHRCLEFCPSNLKNSGGVCIECFEKSCSEKPKVEIRIDRYLEDKFKITLTRKILNMNKDNMKEFIKVEIPNVNPNFYEYEIEPISDIEAEINLKIKETLYNKYLKVSLNKEKMKEMKLYDDNYNEVASLEASLHIGTIAYLEETEKIIVDILSIIVIVLFVVNFVMLILFFCSSCGNNKHLSSYHYKKMIRFATKIQFIGFLIFLNCQMSPQLRRFLKKIFTGCVGFSQIFGSLQSSDYMNDLKTRPTAVYERHINFEEHEVYRYFLQNFGLIVIIHGLIFLGFVIINVMHKVSSSMSTMLDSIKKIFNLNTLIWFFIFQIPIYVFVLLNLKFLNFGANSLFAASSVFTIIYIIAFVIIFGYIFSIFLQKELLDSDSNRFSPEKFYSVSYYHSGFKKNRASIFFEIFYIVYYMLHCILLVFFYNWPSIHVISAAILLFVFLMILVTVNPFESKFEYVLEICWNSKILLIYVALAFMSYLDLDNQKALNVRKIVGWMAVIIIFLGLMIYFISLVYQNIKYLRKILRGDKVGL